MFFSKKTLFFRLFQLAIFSPAIVSGQEIPIYTQHFVNPFVYNPAFAGIEGRTVVALTHRRQWVGIIDAPVTSNLVFHTPLALGVNVGLNISQDEAGVLKNTSALATVGYTLGLGWNHYLTFGLSAGAGSKNIDLTGLNLNDPALSGILDNSFFLDGNAGLGYHIRDLTIGVTLPRIFRNQVFSVDNFNVGNVDVISNFIVTADYMIYFSAGSNAFQPYILYRAYDGFPTQFEGGGIVHLRNLLWIGGTFRQDFGYSAVAGINLNGGLAIGYAYEIPAVKYSGVNSATHEFHLSFAFGEKNNRSKKHSTFLASEQVMKPREEKKDDPEPIVVDEPEPEPEPEPEAQKPSEVNPETEKEAQSPDLEVETKPTTDPARDQPSLQRENEPKDPVLPENESISQPDKPRVTVRRGMHPLELESGHYVVVGAFGVLENAIKLQDRIREQGIDGGFGYSSEKGLFYVFAFLGDNPEITRSERDKLRNNPQFSDAWYLLVE